MRTQVPPYGQGPKNPSKARTVRLEYVLPLEGSTGAHISSVITLDWNTFVDMVEENQQRGLHKITAGAPVESLYQGVILHEILTYYRMGLRLPTKLTCRDTIVARNEELMMAICAVNNYSFCAVLC